ncbi:MAG: hypothetical protein IT184_17770 [Acidobacteria bacterium]|nr:hypothetical protein [Acidobacteriota bacterium]
MDRLKPLLVALALIVCLVAPSPPSIPGDGGEYVVLALNFAELKGPSIAAGDLPGYMQELAKIRPDIVSFDPSPFMRRARGSLDYLHFWFYSLLAVPGVWLTRLVGASPVYGFALLNAALLLGALAVALPRLGTPVSVLLFASPIVWWIDKPHTEPYTFAMLTIAMVLFEERPWWAVLAAGAAAVQNPVAYAFLGLTLAGGVLQGRRVFLDRRWIAAALAAIALASVHVIYFWTRYRTPFPLVDTTQPGMPDMAETLVPLLDPNLGLLPNFPALAIAVAAAAALLAWRRPRALVQPDVLVAGAAAVVFLLGFARNVNYHHGGTPSVSRYGLWLIPLTIPLVGGAARIGGAWWRRSSWGLAVTSAVVSIYAFHPVVVQNSREPTWAADYLWTKHPLWNDPLPQTFVESQQKTEDLNVPVATSGCEKILINGRRKMNIWPMPCYPEPLPDWCVSNLCYANLVNGKYVFSHAPGRDRGPGNPLEHTAWPPAAEPRVREFYNRMSWWTLRAGLELAPMVRQVVGASVESLQGPSGTILVLQEIKSDAVVVLRPPGPYIATVVDPIGANGETVLSFDGPAFERWEIRVPAGDVMLVGLVPQKPSAG